MFQALRTVARIGCLLAFGAIIAAAQTVGQVAGVVRDTTGSVLPGVTLTVTGGRLRSRLEPW